MFPAASRDWLLATFFTNQLYFSLLPLRAYLAPNKTSQFQMMESKVLDSWSTYYISCPWSIQGLLQSQYINTTALALWLLKQNPHCWFHPCPTGCAGTALAFQPADKQDFFQNYILSRFLQWNWVLALGSPLLAFFYQEGHRVEKKHQLRQQV